MMQFTIQNNLSLSCPVPRPVWDDLFKRLTMPNPKFIEAKKHGRYTKGIPRHLRFIHKDGDTVTMPRGFTRQLADILAKHGVPFDLADRTRLLPEVEFEFHGTLHDHQQAAADKVLARRFGVAQLPTGAGKTVLALYVIAQRRQPALVVCHTKELLHQWVERASQFLGLAPDEIGQIGDGKRTIGGKLTISIVNSLVKCSQNVSGRVGSLIVDECHRTPSRTFTQAVAAFDARYQLGLTATPIRRDGLDRLINLYLGDQVCQVAPGALQAKGKIMSARLVSRQTGFHYQFRNDYSKMLSALTQDSDRTARIARDAVQFAKKGRGPALVVSDRKAHCHDLAERIKAAGVKVAVLTGSTPKKQRQAIVEAVNQGKVDVLVSTLSLIGEGFDCKSLAALFLGTPVKFEGRVKQVVGRVLRVDEGKAQPVVYDYVDRPGVLKASFNSRRKAYREIGITT